MTSLPLFILNFDRTQHRACSGNFIAFMFRMTRKYKLTSGSRLYQKGRKWRKHSCLSCSRKKMLLGTGHYVICSGCVGASMRFHTADVCIRSWIVCWVSDSSFFTIIQGSVSDRSSTQPLQCSSRRDCAKSRWCLNSHKAPRCSYANARGFCTIVWNVRWENEHRCFCLQSNDLTEHSNTFIASHWLVNFSSRRVGHREDIPRETFSSH